MGNTKENVHIDIGASRAKTWKQTDLVTVNTGV